MSIAISEKIIIKVSGKKETGDDDIVMANIDVAMINDLTMHLSVESFEEIGVPRVWDSEKIVVILDHQVPADSLYAAMNHSIMRKFVKYQGINNFHDVIEGVCHQVLSEKGHVVLGEVIVETDFHTCTHGDLGDFTADTG